MTVKEAQKLKVGDNVIFIPDGALGHVAEKSYAAVRIDWIDGKSGLFPFKDPKCPWQEIIDATEWKKS